MPIAFPSDFDSDINLAKSRFTTLVELANCDDDTEKFEAQLEVSYVLNLENLWSWASVYFYVLIIAVWFEIY